MNIGGVMCAPKDDIQIAINKLWNKWQGWMNGSSRFYLFIRLFSHFSSRYEKYVLWTTIAFIELYFGTIKPDFITLRSTDAVGSYKRVILYFCTIDRFTCCLHLGARLENSIQFQRHSEKHYFCFSFMNTKVFGWVQQLQLYKKESVTASRENPCRSALCFHWTALRPKLFHDIFFGKWYSNYHI